MALFDWLSAASVPKEMIGRTLILGDADTLMRADDFLNDLSSKIGAVSLGVLGEKAYEGSRDCIELPAEHHADAKRINKLKAPQVIVIGAADQRFDLIKTIDAKTIWINANDKRVADCGCELITVSHQRAANSLPTAEFIGDPLINLTELPELTLDESVGERFKEYRERDFPVWYAAATGEDEEPVAYATLFELLRKQTSIMILSPKDPERYEPVYRDAIKYSMPTIRHSRLYTSFIPKKNRVYFIEQPEPLQDFYTCADVVLVGGTLSNKSDVTPDLITPILTGKPMIVGENLSDPMTAAVVEAGVAVQAIETEDYAAAVISKKGDAEAAKNWLKKQLNSRTTLLNKMQ